MFLNNNWKLNDMPDYKRIITFVSDKIKLKADYTQKVNSSYNECKSTNQRRRIFVQDI